MVYCKCYVVDEDTGNRSITDYTSKKHEGKVYVPLLERNFVNIMAMIRSKYLAETGGFDENMTALEDWEAWLRLARRFEFAYVDEPLGNIYSGGGIDHVNTDDTTMLNSLEILAERHKDTLQKEKYIYWLRLGKILKFYPFFGEYRKFTAGWLKLLSLQPLRIFGNIWILINSWILFPLKKYIKHKNLKLFFKLKGLKQKLKGESLN